MAEPKNKTEARAEIKRLRDRINFLRTLVGERQPNGTVLYYETPGAPTGFTKEQLDSVIDASEKKINQLNSQWFAEGGSTPTPTTAAPVIPPPETSGTPTSQPSATTPTTVAPAPSTTPSTTTTPGTFVPAPGQSVFGGTPVTPGTGAGATGIPLTSATNVPASRSNDKKENDSFTDTTTGVTYQPGQQIGGEDRTLPNGGAVVGGVYIPPGVDYTWLGQQIPPDWESAAKELYGGYYEMVKQYPELGTLLKNAIQQEWSDDKFQYELQQTNWWRTTTQNAREFETLRIQDPASAQTQLDNRTALLRETAQRLGITLGAESLAKLAEDSIKLGLDMTSQLEDIIGSEAIRTSGGVSQLRYGFVGNSLRESARKYGVALSDVTFNEWLNKIAVGSESTETFESYAAQIARTLYPTLSSGFDRGLSFGQMTDPYAQVASRILEIPTTQVDFTDPKWAQAFTMKNEKGEQVPMSFAEWADYLRTTPSFGYQYTDDARSKAYNVVDQLARAFGAA